MYTGLIIASLAVSLALRYWAGSYDSEPSSSVILLGRHFPSLLLTVALPQAALNDQDSTLYWLKAYVALSAVSLVLFGLRAGVFLLAGLRASRTLYDDITRKIFGSPIRFFDTVPSGRILNRLSKDLEIVDQDVAPILTFLSLELLGGQSFCLNSHRMT